MKVFANKVDGFISNLDPSLFSALVYGPDLGLVSTRAEVISKQIVEDLSDPFSVVNISYEDIKEDQSLLYDELRAISFGGGRRLVRVKDAGNNLTSFLKKLLKEDVSELAQGAFLLVTAGELNNKSSLRKLYEDSPNISALPCYVEGERDLSKIVSDTLQSGGKSFDRDVVPYVAAHCQGDRMIVMQELEKLNLYVGDKPNIELEDAMTSIGKTTETTMDDICNAVAGGDLSALEKHMRKAQQQGIVPIALLRTMQRYFMRLREVQGKIDDGKSAEQAFSSLRPPIFFKQKAAFGRHYSIWSRQKARKIDRALDAILDAEIACKKTGSNPELISSRCVMRIASMVA